MEDAGESRGTQPFTVVQTEVSNDFSECDWTVLSFGRLLCVHMCVIYVSVHVLYLAIISYYI